MREVGFCQKYLTPKVHELWRNSRGNGRYNRMNVYYASYVDIEDAHRFQDYIPQESTDHKKQKARNNSINRSRISGISSFDVLSNKSGTIKFNNWIVKFYFIISIYVLVVYLSMMAMSTTLKNIS